MTERYNYYCRNNAPPTTMTKGFTGRRGSRVGRARSPRNRSINVIARASRPARGQSPRWRARARSNPDSASYNIRALRTLETACRMSAASSHRFSYLSLPLSPCRTISHTLSLAHSSTHTHPFFLSTRIINLYKRFRFPTPTRPPVVHVLTYTYDRAARIISYYIIYISVRTHRRHTYYIRSKGRRRTQTIYYYIILLYIF